MAFKPTDLPCPVAPATSKWGHFCQIERVRFIRDGSSQCYRKGIFGFLEFLDAMIPPHGNDFRILVRHFNTDGSGPGIGGDDTYA